MNNDFSQNKESMALLEQRRQQAFVHFQAGQLQQAESLFRDIVSIWEQDGLSWKLLGVALKLQGKHGDALRAMYRATELLPTDEQAYNNFGAALSEANELVAAERYLQRALAINPHYAHAYNNLGNVLCHQGKLTEAEAYQRQALAIDPGFIDALNNLGGTLSDQGRIGEALACYEQALAIQPDFADAHRNASMCKLMLGDFAQGWQQYEWRWQTPAFQEKEHYFSGPKWLGKEALQQKTILLYAEQGLGDTIQFCRYVKLLADQDATIILQVPGALKPLLVGLSGVDCLLADDEAIPLFDYHCPLMSLPLACDILFGHAIPDAIPYLVAAPIKVQSWRNKLPDSDSPRLGIAWRGNPNHRQDYRRSIPFEKLVATLAPHAWQIISLQKEWRPEEISLQVEQPLPTVLFFGDELSDFSETAALIASLDLVITVDTAVAHLAAAMGKPVWLLLSFQADWRWQTGRNDSPWYPEMRLFRQTVMGDWYGVLKELSHAIQRKTNSETAKK